MDGEARGIRKSRDMGLSVIAVGYGLWLWLVKTGVVVSYGSRKEALVHKLNDIDSLLEKARFMLEWLPGWLLPEGWDASRHFNYMNIMNPANRNLLKGEGGKKIGHGGRSTLFFADEFSLVEYQQASHAGITANADAAIYFGTSQGAHTYFSGLESRKAMPFMVLPWYLDPRKLDDPEDAGDPTAPSQWRDKKLRETEAHIFAQQ